MGCARGRTRYEFNHHRLARLSPRGQRILRPLQAVNAVQPWLRVTTSTGFAFGLRDRSPWGDDLVLRGGSFFCTLSRLAVESVLRFAEARPDVAEHLSGSIAPDEVYLQTALGWAVDHDPLAKSCTSTATASATSTSRKARSTTPGRSPRLTFQRFWRSGADFARKFDEARYPGVLDLVDAQPSRARSPSGNYDGTPDVFRLRGSCAARTRARLGGLR